MFAACGGNTPYADHVSHECVAKCPQIQNEANKDCEGASHAIALLNAEVVTGLPIAVCSGNTPYVSLNKCVAKCPAGQAPNDDDTCEGLPSFDTFRILGCATAY